MKNGGLDVLCIDDDACHVQLLRQAAARDARKFDLTAFARGDEALRHLREEGRRPDIILLDYNLPGRDGLSVLRELKADAHLKVIPVLMLSGVEEARHVRRAYECGANIYFVKPLTFERYTELVALCLTLWAGLAELPRDETVGPPNFVR
jgi:DNA-binding response OmpR family regulator